MKVFERAGVQVCMHHVRGLGDIPICVLACSTGTVRALIILLLQTRSLSGEIQRGGFSLERISRPGPANSVQGRLPSVNTWPSLKS